jgi:hypothetical protein
VSGSIVGLVLVTILGLLWLVAQPALFYDRDEFLKSPEITKIREDLAAGRSQSARTASLQLEEKMWWYSGVPSAIVAATYLQDHFRGQEGALELAGGYAKKAHDRESSHVSQYYLGIYYYEQKEFVFAGEIFGKAYSAFIHRRLMVNAPKSSDWQANLLILINAANEAEKKGSGVDLRALDWNYLL